MKVSAVKYCAIFAALALIMTHICWSADTTSLRSRDGNCQVSVPADWSLGQLPGTAESSDKQLIVTITSPRSLDSFSDLKQTAKFVYKGSKVTRDSATDFVLEGQSVTGKPDVYHAISIGSSRYCIVEVVYESGSPEPARAITQTLKAVR